MNLTLTEIQEQFKKEIECMTNENVKNDLIESLQQLCSHTDSWFKAQSEEAVKRLEEVYEGYSKEYLSFLDGQAMIEINCIDTMLNTCFEYGEFTNEQRNKLSYIAHEATRLGNEI